LKSGTSKNNLHGTRTRTGLWPVLTLVLIALLLATQLVSAHAILLKSDPADHATLAEPPSEIRMWFSEDVNLELSSVRVMDENGEEVNSTLLSPDLKQPNLVSVSLSNIGAGVYTVAYAVQSRMDGHMNEGSLSFGVGKSAGTALAGMGMPNAADNILITISGILFRWLNYISLAFHAGVFVIALWVLSPSSISTPHDAEIRHLQHQARQRVLAWGVVMGVVAFLAGLGYLGWQAGDLLYSAQPGTSFSAVADRLLFHSRAGTLWMVRQGLMTLVLLLVSLTVRLDRQEKEETLQTQGAKRVRWLIGLGVVLSVGLMVTQSLVSHAATLQSNSGMAIALDAIHLLAVGGWLGGMVSLRIGLSPLINCEGEEFVRLTRATWSPFSIVAALSVAILFATGIYATGQQVASLDALLETPYGTVLIAKMVVFALVGLFGLLNSMMLHPAFFNRFTRRLGKPAGWTPLPLSRMPVVTIVEACTGAIVLFIVGYLVANPAANSPEFRFADVQQADPIIQSYDGITVVLSIAPNQPGANNFKIGVSDPAGNPPSKISRVIVRISYQGESMGVESADAVQTQPGIFELKSDSFSMVGPWNVDVVVRRLGFNDTTLHFDWVVPPLDQRSLVSNQDWQPVLTGLGALILALIGLAIGRLFWRRHRQPVPKIQ
jgi:copper transport protein